MSIYKGGVAEWSNAAVLKTVILKGIVGSNPTASADCSVTKLADVPSCLGGVDKETDW